MNQTIRKILLSLPVKVATSLAALYLLLAYLAVDPLARHGLPWYAENKLASQASVGHVSFDPWRLSLTVENLWLTRANGEPLAGFKRLFVDLEASGLLHLVWRIKDIRVTEPQVTLDIAPDGRLNWADLMAKLGKSTDKEKSDSIPRVLIDHILVERGNIQYSERNRASPFKAALSPLDLELDGLSTLPDDHGGYQIVAKLPEQGGTLKWNGDISLNPISSEGTVALEGVKIAKLMQIVPPHDTSLQVSSGELMTGFGYRFDMAGADQPWPEATVSDITLTVDNASGSLPQAAGSALELKKLTLALPELFFSLQQGLQLRFQGLDAGVEQAALHLDNAPLFILPQARVGGIDFELGARRLQVAEVSLANASLQVRRNADGSFDWQRLADAIAAPPVDATAAAKPENQGEKAAPFHFDIAKVRLNHWAAKYQDASFKHALSLDVSNVDSGFSLSNASGAIAISGIESTLGPLTLSSAKYSQPLAVMKKLTLQGGELQPQDNTARIERIVLSGLHTQVVRDADTQSSWEAAFMPASQSSPASAEAKASSQTSAGPAWKLNLERLALENGSVHLEDKSVGSPVSLDIENAALVLQNISQDMAKPVPASLRFMVKQGGSFNASGKVAPAPLNGKVTLQLKSFSFKPFAPYINQLALLHLDGGNADVGGSLVFKSAPALSAQFQGGFSVENLALSEEEGGATFLKWQMLASDSLKLGLSPDRLHMDELRIVRPQGKIIIHEDKSTNIQRIMRVREDAPQAAGEPKTPADDGAGENGFPVSVDRVRIEEGGMEFADLSLTPQFGTRINTLSGVINGLSSSPATTAQVELDGKVDEYGSARIRGSVQPFHASDFTDLKLAFHNLEMNRLTPYSGKFAGRRIDSGRMSVDLEYKIKQRQLSGENKFVINKLKLGERVDSPDAVSLPLDLAIALLEDSDGIIDLDLPVAGSLDDPEFSYGKIVWKAFVNVLGKIVTSPFRALGSLLGIGSGDLEAVSFDYGSTEPSPPEQEKIKKLGEAMAKRPALTLTIIPAYDPVADRTALQETAIRLDVLQEMGLELKPGDYPGPIDIYNPKVQAAIRKLVHERSPEAKNRSLAQKLKDYLDISQPTDPAAYEAMVQQLQQWVSIPDKQLEVLAEQRADAMLRLLEQTSGIGVERLVKSTPEPIAGKQGGVPLNLQLGTSAHP